jgi:hypothetical protein
VQLTYRGGARPSAGLCRFDSVTKRLASWTRQSGLVPSPWALRTKARELTFASPSARPLPSWAGPQARLHAQRRGSQAVPGRRCLCACSTWWRRTVVDGCRWCRWRSQAEAALEVYCGSGSCVTWPVLENPLATVVKAALGLAEGLMFEHCSLSVGIICLCF